MSTIRFPEDFVETKLPGYFWNKKEKKLYSLKIGGVLREMTLQKPNYYNHYRSGYNVSDKGRSRFLEITYLYGLNERESNYTIPVIKKEHGQNAQQS